MLNLQDMFLNQLRKEKIMVTVYLVNGFQLRGYVKGFDTFTIVVENEGRQNPVKLLENIPVQPESTASEKLSAASEKETGAQQEPQAQPKQDTEQPQQ